MTTVRRWISENQVQQCCRILIIVILTIISNPEATAQYRHNFELDTTAFHGHLRKVWIMPAVLIGAGLIAITDNEIFDRYEIHEERNAIAPAFKTHIDDYLQFAPIAAVVALNMAGVKGRHDPLNQILLIIKSELIMTAIVLPLKKLTAVPRPDSGAPNSFPSGHTAQAFAAATFLHLEYGRDRPLISVVAFTTAAGIGVLRVMNNRHWVSDVLAGAGIGILSTNLAYLTHQNKWGHRRNVLSKASITPSFGKGGLGLFASIPL
ncbi:MAG: phosphatase PAP2 family protein [Chryseolinea sp.]